MPFSKVSSLSVEMFCLAGAVLGEDGAAPAMFAAPAVVQARRPAEPGLGIRRKNVDVFL